MRILGIDPGLNITGYGLLDTDEGKIGVVEAGVIRTAAKSPMESRLCEISTELGGIIRQFQPEAVAVEELYSHYGHGDTVITDIMATLKQPSSWDTPEVSFS